MNALNNEGHQGDIAGLLRVLQELVRVDIGHHHQGVIEQEDMRDLLEEEGGISIDTDLALHLDPGRGHHIVEVGLDLTPGRGRHQEEGMEEEEEIALRGVVAIAAQAIPALAIIVGAAAGIVVEEQGADGVVLHDH